MSTQNESEKRMEALQKQMLALTEMFVASQNLKLQSETASEAEVATAAKIRQQFGGQRPSDLHTWFRSHLEKWQYPRGQKAALRKLGIAGTR
jgi:1,2-phenylacetyl-CoA epoxidase catalytic subunit